MQNIKLSIPKAIELVNAVELNPFAEFIQAEIHSNKDEEIIVDLEIEIPQKCKYDIRNKERISIVFDHEDLNLPKVYALRDDFPLVSHLNLEKKEKPRCLCLYEESYDELKLKWSSFSFLERIREWLRLTAIGELHADNQILEPLLFYNSSFIVLPSDIFNKSKSAIISAREVISNNIKTIIINSSEGISKADNLVITYFEGAPQSHGLISKIPQNIPELNELVFKAGINIIEKLRTILMSWTNNQHHETFFNFRLILLFILPKKDDKLPQKGIEIRAFLTKQSIKEIGVQLGIWAINQGKIGKLIPIDKTKNAKEIELEMLNPLDPFTPELAQLTNNMSENNLKIISIGAGAIGSLIFNNLVRQGIGKWTVIDNDIMLPHNIGRHLLGQEHIGKHKAEMLAEFANNLYNTDDIAKYMLLNVLNSKDQSYQEMLKEMEIADVIFDFSASIPVARHIALDIISNARRISSFYTLNGQDSVFIAEDKERKSKLDMLEMQYYRFLVNNDELTDHLQYPKNQLRVGYSCRDINSRLPFDLAVQHAAFCSTEIKDSLTDIKPRICIWTTKDNNVKKYQIPIYKETRLPINNWTLVYDDYLIENIQSERQRKLPNETGGILIGSYDNQRKIIYIVDSLSSPADSIEWPSLYIRGIKGIKRQLKNVEDRTNKMLSYIGEWHSHPKGYSSVPSHEDRKAFEWLTKVSNESGNLPLMLIMSEDYHFYYDKITDEL